MSYDPRNINQMYEQYSKTHSSKPVKFNKSPLDDDTSSSFDQFTRRETTRGLGSPTKPDDDDKQEDTGGVKGFLSRVFNLFDTSGAKKSTPIDYEGSSVYNRKEFNIKPTPVSVAELEDAPQGYDPLGINTRDFGKGVDTYNTDTDPEIPETAMIDIGNLNKEDVKRGTPSSLAKAAAVSAGMMTPALPGMADAVNRTLSSLQMDSTEVPYVIQTGDTLSAIAAKTGTTVNDLVKANKIKNKNKIYAGEELVIPTERTTMTKDDVVSAIIRGYERDKDMSGVQVASADPDAKFYNSFRQVMSPEQFDNALVDRIVELEGFIPEARLNFKTDRFPTIGYGQSDSSVKLGQKTTQEESEKNLREKLIPEKIETAKRLFPDFNNFSDGLKIELVQGIFRGDFEEDHDSVKLINQKKWDEAAVEFLDHDEYEEAKRLGKRSDRRGIVDRLEAISTAIQKEQYQ